MASRLVRFLEHNGIDVEDYFAHYGKKGMKWGIRKDRSSGGSRSSSSPSNTKPKAETAKLRNTFSAKPQNRRMTDQELRNRINRLDMERRYKELTAPTPKADRFVKKLLVESGQSAARQLANRAVTVGVQLAIESVAKQASGSNKVFLTAMAENAGGKKKK